MSTRVNKRIFREKFDPYKISWKDFLLKLENYFAQENIVNEFTKRESLLSCLNEKSRQLLRQLVQDTILDVYPYKRLVQAFNEEYKDTYRGYLARNIFYEAKKSKDESLYQWHIRVKHLARNCQFSSAYQTIIKDKFLLGLDDEELKQRVYETSTNITYMELFDVILQEAVKMQHENNFVLTNSECMLPPPRPSSAKPTKFLTSKITLPDEDVYEIIEPMPGKSSI